jgi:excisionase family DNA binding protein
MVAQISYNEAAAILGCHVSYVAKLVVKGELRSSGKRGGSLDRDKVEALAGRRAEERAARAAQPPVEYQRVDHRPDHEHDWLSPRQAPGYSGSPA